MRVMVIIKADKDTEAGVMPSEQILAEMGKYNEELVKAGRGGAAPQLEGASASASPTRSAPSPTGPFAETKELIAGSGCGR